MAQTVETLHFAHASALSRAFPFSGKKLPQARRASPKVVRVSRAAQGLFPRTGCRPRNEQCVCPPGEGAVTDEMLVSGQRRPLGTNRESREARPRRAGPNLARSVRSRATAQSLRRPADQGTRVSAARKGHRRPQTFHSPLARALGQERVGAGPLAEP